MHKMNKFYNMSMLAIGLAVSGCTYPPGSYYGAPYPYAQPMPVYLAPPVYSVPPVYSAPPVVIAPRPYYGRPYNPYYRPYVGSGREFRPYRGPRLYCRRPNYC